MNLNRFMISSLVAAIVLFGGCAAAVEPSTPEAHEKLTIAEAEGIVDERNKQIVLDVDKIARVTAILTKKMQTLDEKVNGISEQSRTMKGLSDDIYLIKKDLAELREMRSDLDRLRAEVDDLNRIKDGYLAGLNKPKEEAKIVIEEKKPLPKEPKKKKKVYTAPAIEEFSLEDGRVIVKYKTAFTRSEPNTLASSKATAVKEGDIFTYTAKSEHWYKLKSGLFINKMVVCETTICAGVAKKGDPIKTATPAITKAPPPVVKTPLSVVKPAPAVGAPVPPSAKVSADIIKPAK